MGWEGPQGLAAPLLTQQSPGPAPAERVPCPDVHPGLSLRPPLGLAAESRDGNQIRIKEALYAPETSSETPGGRWVGKGGALEASQSLTVCGGRCKSWAGLGVLTRQKGLLGESLK